MRCLVLLLSTVCLVGCSLDRRPVRAKERGSDNAGVGAANAAGESGASAGTGLAGMGFAGVGSAGNGSAGLGAAGGASADACGGCDDGVFCNGSERCAVADRSADARGCVSTPACAADQICNETTRSCDTQCAVSGGDADHDGFVAASCGGDDCDDANPFLNPAATELCDGVDNDCSGKVDDGVAQFSCLAPNTLASCVAGQCVISFCSTGYADCDAVVSNGCEKLLDTTFGDCQTSDCSGNAIVNTADTPLDDGNACTIEACNGGMPATEDAANGTSCGSGKQAGHCATGTCM